MLQVLPLSRAEGQSPAPCTAAGRAPSVCAAASGVEWWADGGWDGCMARGSAQQLIHTYEVYDSHSCVHDAGEAVNTPLPPTHAVGLQQVDPQGRYPSDFECHAENII